MAKAPSTDSNQNTPQREAPSGAAAQTADETQKPGTSANNEETPQRKEEADRPNAPIKRDDPLAGLDLDGGRTAGAQKPEEKEPPVRVQMVPPEGPQQPDAGEASSENVAVTPTGVAVDTTVADPSRMMFNRENNDIAPVPRNQMDQDVSLDPMKRQPGDAPSSAPAQLGEESGTEEGAVPYVMVMPYWDGVQMHEKGTILPFKPGEQPQLAKRVVKPE